MTNHGNYPAIKPKSAISHADKAMAQNVFVSATATNDSHDRYPMTSNGYKLAQQQICMAQFAPLLCFNTLFMDILPLIINGG